jgi:hypothetical protein
VVRLNNLGLRALATVLLQLLWLLGDDDGT